MEALREVLTDREISYDVVRDNGPVETTIRVENLRSDLVITRALGVGVGLERGERLVRESSVDDLTFSIGLGSTGQVVQDGRELTTTSGTGIFYTSARPMLLGLSDFYDNLMLQVPRRQLRRITGEDIPLGTQVPPTTSD